MVKDMNSKDSPLSNLKKQCAVLQRMVAQRSKSLKAGVAKSKAMHKTPNDEPLQAFCIACEMVYTSKAKHNVKASLEDWDGVSAAVVSANVEKLAVASSKGPYSLVD
jgi:hypothetical protein